MSYMSGYTKEDVKRAYRPGGRTLVVLVRRPSLVVLWVQGVWFRDVLQLQTPKPQTYGSQ